MGKVRIRRPALPGTDMSFVGHLVPAAMQASTLKLRLAFLLACLLSVPALCTAAEVDDSLHAADARWNSLRLLPDVEGLSTLLADDWVLTHSDGRVQHKADYLGELSTRSRSNQSIGNEDVQVRRYGDTAVVTGTSVQAGTRDGTPWSGRFRFTRTWVWAEDRWQMVASHSSRIATQE